MDKIDWAKEHVLFVANEIPEHADTLDAVELRPKVEPWLTALFQSEHLTLLMGAGISYAIHDMATGKKSVEMNSQKFKVFADDIEKQAEKSASCAGRGTSNIEDRVRVANEIACGIRHLNPKFFAVGTPTAKDLKTDINCVLDDFIKGILLTEKNVLESKKASVAIEYLISFLVSFASRSATRERLNIFTTNYDRFVEFASDIAGIRLLDRFVGTLSPLFRSSRLEVDMHYNPPGIRGEPRYLEGVVHFSKLHGSLDWIYHNGYVRRIALPFGSESIVPYLPKADGEDCCPVMIYPNAAKDRETAEYPYVDLFRDFAAGVCRPNSTLVVYGYSFGDEHINRVIKDMLSIPSTHLVIIAYDDDGKRVSSFAGKLRTAQLTVLIGSHFGDLKTLVDNYLPKPAIDKASIRMADLLKARGIKTHDSGDEEKKDEGAKE
ncbi:MAG: SIR2 family protein [Desulfobacterales bacterium]|nr:SIR2 family protein [Desulfobacterales bacterium]